LLGTTVHGGNRMAGNAWKYSGVLDDYDLAFLQRDFITIKQGVEYYGFSERPFIRMAKEAGAFYKIGKMVVELGKNMFGQLSYGIETIIISEGIKRIGQSVLFGHSNLTKIVFPASVEKINPAVFSDDKKEYKDLYLRGSDLVIVVPAGSYAEMFIKEYQFENTSPRIVVEGDGCPDYLNIVESENGYKAIFQKGLEPTDRIVVPDKYKDKEINKLILIESDWGDLPEELASISIPASVSEIVKLSKARFTKKCEDGTPSIIVADGNKSFWSDGMALYSADRKSLIQLIDYTVEEYAVADGTEIILAESFARCSALKKVVLPSSITSIEKNAFYSCSNLSEIVGMDRVGNVGNGAISYTALEKNSEYIIAGNTLAKYNGKGKKVIIPEGVEVISEKAFYYSKYSGNGEDKLEEVVLPSTLKCIEKEAFSGRTVLKKINLPDGLLSIKYGAFADCKSLESLVIPASVTEIESCALPTNRYSGGIPELVSIVVADGNKNYCSIDNVLYLKDMSEIIYVPYEAKMEEYIIPASVKKVSGFYNKNVKKLTIEGDIEASSFACESLKSVVFGEKQSVISGFTGCKKLSEVVWPKYVREIQRFAFQGTAIKDVVLPDTVEVIHTKAFADTKIKNFVVPKSVKYIGKEIVSGAIETVTVFDSLDADFFEYNKLIGMEEENKRYTNGSFSLVKYIAGGGEMNSKWRAYRIIVKSAETDEVKFYIDMPSSDNSRGDISGILPRCTKGTEFDFAKADSCFGDMCVPKPTISSYENDRIDIKGSVIVELANELHTEPNYLLLGEIKKEADPFVETMVAMIQNIKDEKTKELLLLQMRAVSSI